MEIIIGYFGIGAYLYIALIWTTHMLEAVSDKERREVRRAWRTIIFCWPILSLYGMLLICAWVCEDIWSGLGEIINHG